MNTPSVTGLAGGNRDANAALQIAGTLARMMGRGQGKGGTDATPIVSIRPDGGAEYMIETPFGTTHVQVTVTANG